MAFFQSNLKLYGLVSTSLFIWTVLHAFRQRSNFYSAAVYLSKSNASLMVRAHLRLSRTRRLTALQILWNQGIYQTILFGKVLQWIFFGELRIIEVEVSLDSRRWDRALGADTGVVQRLQERGWFAVTETLLALTIFKDEFDSSFVMLFVSLLFLKVFHWLAADRVEMVSCGACWRMVKADVLHADGAVGAYPKAVSPSNGRPPVPALDLRPCPPRFRGRVYLAGRTHCHDHVCVRGTSGLEEREQGS